MLWRLLVCFRESCCSCQAGWTRVCRASEDKSQELPQEPARNTYEGVARRDVVCLGRNNTAFCSRGSWMPLARLRVQAQLKEHYKMKRHSSAAGLCLFGLRSVSVTQIGCAVCVIAVVCQSYSMGRQCVFFRVTHLISLSNDRLVLH